MIREETTWLEHLIQNGDKDISSRIKKMSLTEAFRDRMIRLGNDINVINLQRDTHLRNWLNHIHKNRHSIEKIIIVYKKNEENNNKQI